MADLNEQDLLDYDEEEQEVKDIKAKKDVKVIILTLGGTREQIYIQGSYVSIHSSGFRDFLLNPELLKAIVDCGFEHPSQVKSNDSLFSHSS